jgi:subtilisin-like proprotein convertase family protein
VAAAVTAAATWVPLGPEAAAEASASPALAIPDGSAAGASSTVTLADDITVEWVDVWLTADHTKWTQLEVVLTSPAGTESVLATAERTSAPSAGYANWRFGSARHLGESSQGAWKLTVRDRYSGTSGTFSSWRVKAYGTPAADATPPVTTHDYDDEWRRGWVTVSFTAADAGSGVAFTEWRMDGGPWQTGDSLTLSTRKRGSGSGLREVEYRSRDNAGNLEAARSVTLKLDSQPPLTRDDADYLWHMTPVTVTLTATDALSGSPVTSFSVDGGPWQTGTSVVVPAPAGGGNVGEHVIHYFSVDAVGNVEPWRSCLVRIGAQP